MPRPLFTIVMLAFILTSCDPNRHYEMPPIQLEVQQVINDSAIRLAWTPLPDKVVKQYRLTRSGQQFLLGNMRERKDTILLTDRGLANTAEDNTLPLGVAFTYRLEVETTSGTYYSNDVEYVRKQALFPGNVQEILVDTVRKNAYVVSRENSSISLFKYAENLLVRKVVLSSPFQYCTLAEVNGSMEIFVPHRDGWIDIYGGASLDFKERIQTGSASVHSVVFHNNLLFVSTDDMEPVNGVPQPIKVFDRNNKKLVGRAGRYPATRLFLVPGSDTELFGVVNSYPNQKILYYKFDHSGALLTEKQDDHTVFVDKAPDFTQVSPSGKYLISGEAGSVVDSDLQFKYHIKNQVSTPNFSDFAFDASGSTLYATRLGMFTIDVFDFFSRRQNTPYTARLYPLRVFRDGQQLYVIGSTIAYNAKLPVSTGYFRFEKITR